MKLRLFVWSLLLSLPLHAQTVLVQPYVQPGSGVDVATDSKQIRWLTDQTPGEFTVEYSTKAGEWRSAAAPQRTALNFAPAKPKEGAKESAVETAQSYFKYMATLPALPLDATVNYRVKKGAETVREGVFATRASDVKPIHFVMVGDLANGKPEQNAVAYEISRVAPQFMVVLGDITYPEGRVSHYMDHYWSTYNQPAKASAETGAPLMASVPFYAVMGNHDVDTHNLVSMPDALGAYHFFNAPSNAAGEGPWNTPLGNGPEAAAFRVAVGESYPNLGIYSFDSGPAHFLILDNSGYVNLENVKLREWIERDLRGSRAPWKFVAMHAPAFHSSREHYTEQKMRLLMPLLESCGVDVVFAGHVHNYQRSVPLRFTPGEKKGGLINGTFKLDKNFDGAANARPDGVVHIVSGGGGGTLYRGELQKNAEFLQAQYPGNWDAFTAKFVADRHSFTVVDLTPQRFTLRAIDLKGAEIDRFEIVKGP